MKITNKNNLPEGFVRACSTNKHNKPGRLSATTLLKGIKEIILTERHFDEIEIDVADQIWAIWGTAVHALLEHEGADEVAEEYVELPMSGITITGRIDNFDLRKGIITDYKTASTWKVKFADFDDWKKQGLIYAMLLIESCFEVKKCRFVALLKDHSKTDAERDASYPQSPVFIYEFNITDDDIKYISEFCENKIKDYLRYKDIADEYIPECTAEERWQKPEKYAVMKSGRKSAVKLFDDKESAEAMAIEVGGYIEHRQGEPTKCKGYCNVNKWCHYWRQYENKNY